jgi:glutaredoxin-related protein
VQEVITAIKDNDVVVVGMSFNPFLQQTCKSLELTKQPYKYLEYSNNFTSWRKRNALKMWTEWPTFLTVFVKGTPIGSADDLKALIGSSEFRQILAPGDGQNKKGLGSLRTQPISDASSSMGSGMTANRQSSVSVGVVHGH